jgi:hypothetical protein
MKLTADAGSDTPTREVMQFSKLEETSDRETPALRDVLFDTRLAFPTHERRGRKRDGPKRLGIEGLHRSDQPCGQIALGRHRIPED